MDMICYIRKRYIFVLAGFLTLVSSAVAETAPMQKTKSKPIGIYFGGFGGWGYCSAHVTQKATAFLSAASGGPLSVNAVGKSKDSTFGFGGLHLGYQWLDRNGKRLQLIPATELEGYYFANTLKANLDNPTTRLDLHLFSDSFPMRTGVILANMVFALANDYIVPYIGAGIGAGIISIHGANSAQTDPPEPGINHFNSDPNAFDWSLAVQAKGGLRYSIFEWMRLFAEYRFLYISPTRYTFGSTQFPGHAPTTHWKVKLNQMHYNLFSAGIDFVF